MHVSNMLVTIEYSLSAYQYNSSNRRGPGSFALMATKVLAEYCILYSLARCQKKILSVSSMAQALSVSSRRHSRHMYAS